ncbi:hypothetical protein BC834DRAFT_923747 [Gloeopeniophorella convolvens]|nr:hypothetical protein BC834DRAFT_923747 [Gloeopeniophorella convolvens]
MLSSRSVPLTANRPLHTKTPGRAIQKARSALQENALLPGSRTAKALKVQLQTPLKDGSPLKSRKPSKDAQFSKNAATTIARPLGDKTPWANRQRIVEQESSPGPAKQKLPSLGTHFEALTPGHVLLPSSARKSVRGRRSSGPIFETPVTKGNHWEVHEDDMFIPTVPEVQEEEAQVEDYDEIEYMPPTAIDPPYTPHFDMPDYKLVGAQLFDMMHSFPRDDALDRFYATERENIDDTGLLEATGFSTSPSQWNFFDLPDDGK